MLILRPALKSLVVLILAIIWGLVSLMIATLIIASVENWDDAPGGGIFILMAGMWTLPLAVILGGAVCAKIFRQRTLIDQCPVWKAAIGGCLGILAGSLMPTALFLLLDCVGGRVNRIANATTAIVLAVVIAGLIYLAYRQFASPKQNRQLLGIG